MYTFTFTGAASVCGAPASSFLRRSTMSLPTAITAMVKKIITAYLATAVGFRRACTTGVRDHHLPHRPSLSYASAEVEDNGNLSISLERKLLMMTTSGILKPKAEQGKEQVSMRGCAHGQHVIDSHAHVRHNDYPEGLPKAPGLLVLGIFRALHEQLHRDPEKESAPPPANEPAFVRSWDTKRVAKNTHHDGPAPRPGRSQWCGCGRSGFSPPWR